MRISSKNATARGSCVWPSQKYACLRTWGFLFVRATSISFGTPSSFGIWLSANTAFFFTSVSGSSSRAREIAEAALKVYEVDGRGLDRLDRAVLKALLKLFGGGPVGLSTLAVAVGEERETVEEVAEPFLVREGLLARTPRGRVATPAAWTHLGLTPPRPPAQGSGQQDLFGP